MRRLRILVPVLAILAAGLVSVTPAHAVASSMCWPGGYGGTVYYDNNYTAGAGGQFYDTWQGKYTRLKSDIQSWNYTPTAGDGSGLTLGHCYRQIRWSVWVDDGSYGMIGMNYTMSKCGSNVIAGSTAHTWAGGQELYSGWYDYGDSGPWTVCAPHGTVTGYGYNATDWTPYSPGPAPSAYASI